ncbi:MAG: hypothetical protein HY010_09025 [Acidobacteria bacterium]|nr:hypothetical protein [Acidobacteriota bacterium]
MNSMRVAWSVALALAAGASLFAGLTELDTGPLSAVLIILGAMGILMFAAGGLPGAPVRVSEYPKLCKSTYTLRRRFSFPDKENTNVRPNTQR